MSLRDRRTQCMLWQNQWVMLMIITVSCCVMFSGCSHYRWQPFREVDMQVIIPDGYEGFLVVYYECPNGSPFLDTGQTIVYEFEQDGLICTSDSLEAMRGKVALQTDRGQELMAFGAPRPETGYGLYGGSTRTISDTSNRKYTLTVFWVGDLDQRTQMQDYDLRFDAFVEDRMGIQRLER